MRIAQESFWCGLSDLVSSGRPGTDRALLRSPRLTLALDALLRVYDHVLLDAGRATDLPAELLTTQARAVVVPDPSMSAEARIEMCDQLKAVGFTAVTMLTKSSLPAEFAGSSPRVAAIRVCSPVPQPTSRTRRLSAPASARSRKAG